MAKFQLTLTGHSPAVPIEADAYLQEGPLTTFFRTRNGDARVDSWSVRVASIKTAEVIMVQRLEEEGALQLSLVG